MAARWEHFPHAADMGVRGHGATTAQAFEQAALALTALITDPGTVQPLESIVIECEAPDRELLFGRFAVEVKGATCTALRVAREPDGWVAETVVDV